MPLRQTGGPCAQLIPSALGRIPWIAPLRAALRDPGRARIHHAGRMFACGRDVTDDKSSAAAIARSSPPPLARRLDGDHCQPASTPSRLQTVDDERMRLRFWRKCPWFASFSPPLS
jgi:hypothetical protein